MAAWMASEAKRRRRSQSSGDPAGGAVVRLVEHGVTLDPELGAEVVGLEVEMLPELPQAGPVFLVFEREIPGGGRDLDEDFGVHVAQGAEGFGHGKAVVSGGQAVFVEVFDDGPVDERAAQMSWDVFSRNFGGERIGAQGGLAG